MTPVLIFIELHHAHTLAAGRHCRSLLFNVGNNRFCCQQGRCNACSVLQSASCNFAGSRMPSPTMFTYCSFKASKPMPGSDSLTLLMITEPSRPAFAAIRNSGASSAFRMILAPVFSSPSRWLPALQTFLEA